MNKIKVLQFPVGKTMGGVTRYALNNWCFIDKNKFQIDFATMSSDELPFEKEVTAAGSTVHHISEYAEINSKGFYNEFLHILLKGKYDVVHLHTLRLKSLEAEKACIAANIKKIIIHAHTTGFVSNTSAAREHDLELHTSIQKNISEKIATDFWACSREAAKFLFGDRIPNDRIKIIHNAIDVKPFVYDIGKREKIRDKFHFKGKFVLGNVGRLVYPKNQEFLINIMPELIQESSNIVLVLIGAGDRESYYRSIIKEKKINENVFLLGYSNKTYEWYQAMDMFLLPSRVEGFSLALLEAQTAGLPCLASLAVPDNVMLTDSAHKYSLDKNVWIKEILKVYNTKNMMDRKSAEKVIADKGYNIAEYIKKIEYEYSKT